MANCKPGDMALVVKSECGNEGKIVTCIRFIGKFGVGVRNAEWWETDEKLLFTDGIERRMAADDWLVPIKPLPKEETETKGEKVKA